MYLRKFSPILLACTLAVPAVAEDSGGISSAMISHCAGKVGVETRQADAAYGVIELDGIPWLAIERTEQSVGTQPIKTTVTGTGAQRRRNGTSVPFRFTCVLDAKGEALMFHASNLMNKLGDELPPAIVVEGSAAYAEKMMLPRGAELRVQLLDLSKSPAGEIMAEQVVRSGWQVPIPFALRLPKNTALEGRKLAVAARLVLAHQALFQLGEPRAIDAADLRKPIDLVLDKVETAKR
ncbi:MAG: YbaY family lipoprotein [Reyranella sp.]